MQPEQSSNSVRIISLKRDELLARLRDMAARLKAEHPEVTEVRLFGSLARGDQTGTSDIDLIILLNQTPETDPHRRLMTYLPYFACDRGVDLLVWTHAELEKRLSQGDHFIKRVWESSFQL